MVAERAAAAAATPPAPPAIVLPQTTVAEAAADAEADATPAVEDGELRYYGHDLFHNRTLEEFRTTDGARVPDTYILGSGDRLRVSIFAGQQADLMLEVTPDGYVHPAGIPRIALQGLTVAQARELLHARLNNLFPFARDQFAVTVQAARTVTVSVFGEARRSGSYTISALNTALHALAAADGPTALGSVRKIEVIRGRDRRRLDLYAFLTDPTTQFDFALHQSDIVFVPPAERLVRIEGAVKRPLGYELLGDEGLAELIAFAGGVNYNTYPDYVQVQRVEGDSVVLREWRLAEVLDGRSRVALRDGDVVRVRTIGRPLERYVEATGAVFYEGRFDLGASPGLAALLGRAQPRPQAKLDLIFIERRRPDETLQVLPVAWTDSLTRGRDVALEPRDRVLIFDRQRYAATAVLRVEGRVRAPVERSVEFGDSLAIADALALAGGTEPSAAPIAYVYRSDLLVPGRVDYIRVDLARDGGVKLGAGDRLVVFDRAMYEERAELAVDGAVRQPARFSFDPRLTIADLVRMAQGVRLDAALDRVEVFRLAVSPEGTTTSRIILQIDSSSFAVTDPQHADFRLEPFDRVFVRSIPSFDLARDVQLAGEVRFPGTYPLPSNRVHLSTVLRQAGGVTPMADPTQAVIERDGLGVIAVDLRAALDNAGEESVDPVLLAGDRVRIPAMANTVQIRLLGTRLGDIIDRATATDSAPPRSRDSLTTVVFQGTRSARWYLKQYAGGFGRTADKYTVTVTDPTGRVRGTSHWLWVIKRYPEVTRGSLVRLELEREKPPAERRQRLSVDELLTRTTQLATTALTLVLLTRQF